MPQIEIRPVTSPEIPALIEFDHGYKSSHVWQMDLVTEDNQIGVRFREIRLPRSIHVEYPRSYTKLAQDWNSRSVVLVGVLAGRPVGYISLSDLIAPTTAWVTDLAVDTAHRRQGIASALILAAQDWARQRRHRRMIIEMQSKNIPAMRLVQKLGYEFCGYNDHYYGNQDIAVFYGQFMR